MPGTILITGAASGLGRAFVQHYASQTPPRSIIAIDSNASPITPSLAEKTVTYLKADITSQFQVSSIAQQHPSQPIDLLIHCAGIRGLVPAIEESNPGDVAAAETLDVMDHATFSRTFEVNTWGTFNVVTTFLPLLRRSRDAKVVILSSRMGSVAANRAGGGYAYRASKAALNAVVRSFSIDVPGVTFCLLHPGRVETGLVRWKEEGAISAEESVRDCLKVIEALGSEDSGRLVDRFGVDIPW
ncbi:NAD(P)-binding protein [Pseudovirgaria hyperparasitica]|uniref:NAD(P)-binding protein n=1 Tax=Pseudovirgaria hyperparasitica TaxID=470096 RepID=A0A6A6VZZ8_9PEZI|nr:NAD(P)-binding protein [Pseudovirgaria hyperparasitica]KAF2755416.1 NAD(P)-binding protein [Pseudovirgaria hyperparasitica]